MKNRNFNYQIRRVSAITTARKVVFTAVKRSIYFLKPLGWCLKNSFSVIRLASEEIMIPSEPTLTDTSRSCQLLVKLERKTAVGTFEINWQEMIPAIRVLLSTIPCTKSLIAEMRAMLPENTKNTQKVASRP